MKPVVSLVLAGALASAVGVASACKRTPPTGSGAIETTGVSPAKIDDIGRGRTMAVFPGGAVLVTNATTCTAARFDGVDKQAKWSVSLPQCEGVLEAVVAPDSVSYVRTPTGLVAIGPDGVEKWRLGVSVDALPRSLLVPAATRDSLVVVASTPRVVMAFKNDSTQAWRFSVAENETLVASPVGSHGEGVFLLTNQALYNVGSDGALRYRRAQTPP